MTTSISDRTILVTGGAGFVGSHIVDALAPENHVRVLDDFSNGSRLHLPTGVEVVEGDVRDDGALSTAMTGVDLVFHEAAMISVGESVDRPRACQAINADATLSVLDHARLEDARVVFASSAAIYGTPDSLPVAESDPKGPRSPYGITKLAGDLYVRRYADLYDLPTVALRYFNVYGPRQDRSDHAGVVEIFARQARRGETITVHGDGAQTRDFVHVDDVVRANLLAATTDATGEGFNVATGRSITVRELAERVRDAAGADVPIVHEDGRPADIERSRADVSKARRRLGYEPTVALDDGLADLLDRDVADSARNA